jgi:hypothetical protein
MLAGASPVFSIGEDVVKMGYVCRDMEGNQRWQGNAEIRKKEGNVYILTEKAEGVYSSFKGSIYWVAEVEFESTKETVRPLSLEKRVFSKNGNPLRVEKQKFDFTENIVPCSNEDIPKKTITTKKFKFDKDIVNRQILGLYTRKMLENGKKSAKVQMVSEEPGFYNMHLSVVKTEDVEINGRKRRAYKLQLDPRLGLLNIAKVFFPKAYAWHFARPDFEWLRYEGLEGDIRSVKVEITTED